jgi:hypothetical protein
VLPVLFLLAVLACAAAPFAIERALHAAGSARIARFAFAGVGTRRLTAVREQIDASAATYRGGRVLRAVSLPSSIFPVRGPNGGVIEITVEPNQRWASVRMVLPTRDSRDGLGREGPLRATLRITPERDHEGHFLRARALPEGLAFAFGLPFVIGGIAAVAANPVIPFLVTWVVVVVITGVFQAQWWLSHGALVRQSAALALDAVAKAVEAEAVPGIAPH